MKTFPAKKSASISGPNGAVVFGTDFSPGANEWVEVAAKIARRFEAPLVLAHALKLPPALRRDAKASRWVIASRKRFLRTATEEVRTRGLKVIDRVWQGSPHKMLAETAVSERARMIVVGSRRRRIFAPWFVPGVANQLSKHATTPTLVLRETAPLCAWLRGERPLKVFVCFNFTAACEAALRWVKQLTDAGPLQVVLGCVRKPPIRPPHEDATSAVIQRDMVKHARTVLGDVPVRCRTAAPVGRTSSRLVQLANEEGADVIVIGSMPKLGFSSLWRQPVSRSILNEAPTNVAIVPLSTNPGRRVSVQPTAIRPRRRRSWVRRATMPAYAA